MLTPALVQKIMYYVQFQELCRPSSAFTIDNTNIVFSEGTQLSVDFVLVLKFKTSIGTRDGTVASVQLHILLDLSSKTVTLPDKCYKC